MSSILLIQHFIKYRFLTNALKYQSLLRSCKQFCGVNLSSSSVLIKKQLNSVIRLRYFIGLKNYFIICTLCVAVAIVITIFNCDLPQNLVTLIIINLNCCLFFSGNYGNCSFTLIRRMSEQASSSTSGAQKPNRLYLEKSPYLLQHAFNPVDWYPWGDEAFEKAKKENKLIFLSVGYSTCHW